jgi:hypothetical protein
MKEGLIMDKIGIDELNNVTGGCYGGDLDFGDDNDNNNNPPENFGNEGLDFWKTETQQKIEDATTNPHSKKYKNKAKNTLKY